MTRTTYPDTFRDSDIIQNLKEISRLREIEDIPDFTNLPNVFISGRTTYRTPSTPLDVLATDNIGDVTTDPAGDFEYKLINVGGTPKWAQIALNTSW